MDEKGLGIFFKASCIIFFCLLITVFFVSVSSPEFYITIIGLVLTFIVGVISAILLNVRKKG
jgi:hypothetical protein